MDPFTIGGYVAGVIGGLLAWFSKRGVAWRDEAEAWKAKADRLDGELSELRTEFQEYRQKTDERVNRLEGENRRLGELAVLELADKIDAYHADVLSRI